LNVIFQDEHLLVIDKPHGQLTQGTAQGDKGSVIAEAREEFGLGVRLVHRLDRDAAGLLIVALTKNVAGVMGDMFVEHEVQRVYHAWITLPLPAGTSGTIDAPLKWAGGRCWVDKAGARAVTHYTVLAREDGFTQLEVSLETGRMHQIRVHLKHALGPIAGDRKYGGARAPHLRLRAVRLAFLHPVTGEALSFSISA